MGTQAIAEFSRHMMRSAGLDSLSIFFCDRRGTSPRLVYMLHQGVTASAQSTYLDAQVFHEDPFTAVALNEEDDGPSDRFIPANDPRLTRTAPPDGRYWDFMRSFQIGVVAASVRALAPRLYATIGMHRSHGRAAQPDEALAPLLSMSSQLQDMVGAFLLSDMLRSSCGLGRPALPRFLVRREGPGSPFAALPEREREVAELVCQGRRNKEIAWLTGLSEHTVENTLRRIYGRLGIHNRAALVAMVADSRALS